nr:hypothetical protein [Tanacetum cinerariifolium]
MDHQYPTVAKIPVLDTGNDSYKVPENSDSVDSRRKDGRTVIVTTDYMQKKKNDVKARTTLLLSLPDEHQLRNDLDSMSLDDLYNHLKVYKVEVQKKPNSNSQDMAFISSSKNSNNEDGNTCKLLAVGSPFFWQWEHPPLAVGTYTASGNSLMAVGMPCAFYSQQVLSDLPLGCKPLGCKWIFKNKMKVDALVATHNLVIHQMDVKTTFLNGDLEDEIYMKQPEGFVMPGCGSVSTPMEAGIKLMPHMGKHVNQLEYSWAIGCLMYAMKSTRSDIAYAVEKLSRFTSNPSNHQWEAIIKELKSMFEKQAGVERFDLIQTFYACKQEEGKPVAAYVLKIKGYVEQRERLGYVLSQDLSVGLILNCITSDFAKFVNYNMHNMGKTIGELHAMLIEYEKGKDKQVYIPKPKNHKPSAKEHPAKDETCHHCKKVGYWKRNCPIYLAELLKKKKQVGTASSSGKMTRRPFSHRTKRAIDLLRITQTDLGKSDGGGVELGGGGCESMCSIDGGTFGGGDIGDLKYPLVDGDVEEVGDLGLEMKALVDVMERNHTFDPSDFAWCYTYAYIQDGGSFIAKRYTPS